MIVEATPENILAAAAALQAGRCVAFPTETVYGLGADATRPSAVAQIYAQKGRPSSNPLIVHVATSEQIGTVAETHGYEKQLSKLEQFWPGPLTVVLPRQSRIPALVAAGGNTIAVRVPAHPIARRLLAECKLPIAAPSANRSTRVSPTSAAHVHQEFGEDLLILDGGPTTIGIESTVLSLTTPVPTILRPGSITLEQLQVALGEVSTLKISPSPSESLPSPGLLAEHYAPRTASILWSRGEPLTFPGKWGLITIGPVSHDVRGYTAHRDLAPNGDLTIAARNLFATLRDLDTQGLDLLVIERCPEVGIGVAIMDRLQRATARAKS